MHKIKSLEKKEGSVVEIMVEFGVDAVEAKWPKAIKAIGEEAKIDGFRKGHIPEKILVEKVGEMAILEEASRLAIDEAFSLIVLEQKLKIIGHPNIVITKIAKGAPLEVTIRVTIVPEINLPDYKKIASKTMKKIEHSHASDEEVEKVLEELKKGRKEAGEPEVIDDEFVKKIGNFKNIDEFKTKLSENIGHEKEYKAREKNRIEVLEEIRKGTNIDVPAMLIENELDRMMGEFSHKLSQMGQTLEQYKKDANKSEDQIREEWKDLAKTRTQNELILIEIARLEKLEPKKEDIERESHHMQEQYPATPKERIVGFIEEVLTKEEVFKFLESQAK